MHDWMLLPNSPLIITWAIIFSIFVIIYFSLAFFAITFNSTIFDDFFNSLLVNVVLLAVLVFDTVILLNTTSVRGGKIILDYRKNFSLYLASFTFWLDFVILLAFFSRIIVSDVGIGEEDVLAVLNLVIIGKFYKVGYWGSQLKFYYFQEKLLLVYEFVKYMILLGLLCHIVGCLFFWIDVTLIQAEWYPLEEHWLITSSAMNGLYYAPVWEQYLYSFYFANVTLATIAYGDITPKNPTETAFVLFLQAFLLLFYAYIFTQIYDIVTFFNRKKIEVRKKKMKVSGFLKREDVPRDLAGRILAEFQYRMKRKKITEGTFISDVAYSLVEKYTKTPYKHEADKFKPRFIRRMKLPSMEFESLITEEFFPPDHPFQSFDRLHKESFLDRKILYVSEETIFRTLHTGTSRISSLAQSHRWLGMHTFITSQMDPNEWWATEMPSSLLVLKFSHFKEYLKRRPESKEIFLEQCHRTIQFGGTSEDMQKCLVCGEGYHSSLHCETQNQEWKKTQWNHPQSRRKKLKRSSPKSHKQLLISTNLSHQEVSKAPNKKQREISIQTQITEQKNRQSEVEQIWNWKQYMKEYNLNDM